MNVTVGLVPEESCLLIQEIGCNAAGTAGVYVFNSSITLTGGDLPVTPFCTR